MVMPIDDGPDHWHAGHMTRASDRLRLIGAFNAYDVAALAKAAGLTPVWVGYRAEQPGRGYRPAAWQIHEAGVATNPREPYWNNGNKTFNVYRREDRAPQMTAALDWASERYGVTEWSKIPGVYGGPNWFPKDVARHIIAQIKAAGDAA